MSVTVLQICEKAADFVTGRSSLREFEEWFVRATWDIHRANNPAAESLANQIDLNIAEHTDGLLNARELRSELANAIRPFAHVPLPVPRALHEPREVDFGFPTIQRKRVRAEGSPETTRDLILAFGG